MGIAGPDADSIKFAGDTITALMWPSRNLIQLKKGSGQEAGSDTWRWTLKSEMWGQKFLFQWTVVTHVSHYWWIHLSSHFPLGRRHCTQLFQEAHCILPGDLCRARGALLPKSRACVLPTENKCQDRLGTALRRAHSQYGKYWILMGAAAGFHRKGTILWKSSVLLLSLGRWEQPSKVICTTEEGVPSLWGSRAQPIGAGCSEQHCVPAKITALGTTQD